MKALKDFINEGMVAESWIKPEEANAILDTKLPGFVAEYDRLTNYYREAFYKELKPFLIEDGPKEWFSFGKINGSWGPSLLKVGYSINEKKITPEQRQELMKDFPEYDIMRRGGGAPVVIKMAFEEDLVFFTPDIETKNTKEFLNKYNLKNAELCVEAYIAFAKRVDSILKTNLTKIVTEKEFRDAIIMIYASEQCFKKGSIPRDISAYLKTIL